MHVLRDPGCTGEDKRLAVNVTVWFLPVRPDNDFVRLRNVLDMHRLDHIACLIGILTRICDRALISELLSAA